ncbi:hypothetical protein TWF730_010205 [Orbilia blumenaviensis]|uniref:F-box domain-containing protein n=1 Tax=Orbilia blumenaviensis TaxID=1796055 RepID=A0AAV9UR21_9PEZI
MDHLIQDLKTTVRLESNPWEAEAIREPRLLDFSATPINTIPTEILVSIFEYLQRKDLINVVRICRRWADAGSPALYRSFRVRHLGKSSPAEVESSKPTEYPYALHTSELDMDIHERGYTPTADYISEITRNIEIFANVRIFNYQELKTPENPPWCSIWKVLDQVVLSMPQLQVLSICYLVHRNEICDLVDFTRPRPCLKSLKSIKLVLKLHQANAKTIDTFFERLSAIFDRAEYLVSRVDLIQSKYDAYLSRDIKVAHKWQLRNMTIFRIIGFERVVPPFLISADFSKLRVLSCEYLYMLWLSKVLRNRTLYNQLRQSLAGLEIIILAARFNDHTDGKTLAENWLWTMSIVTPNIKEVWIKACAFGIFGVSKNGNEMATISDPYLVSRLEIGRMVQETPLVDI